MSYSRFATHFAQSLFLAAGLMAFAGCEMSSAIIPVSDPDLKRTNAQFAADAAKRNYPATAPRGGDAEAMADVDHGIRNRIQLENLSADTWEDVEIWVNEKYVCHLATWPSKTLKKVNFAMLYDRDGHTFPINNKDVRVEKLEMLRGGKLYNMPKRLAD